MKPIKKIVYLLTALFSLNGYAGQKVNLKIDWSSESYILSPEHWSVNDYEILQPQKVSQAGLAEYTRKLSPRMIRIHQAQIADTWSDEILQTWNYERIASSFNAARETYGDAVVLLNPICRWPKWLTTEDRLTENEADKLVEMCRDLALFIKKHPEWNVGYWEILNEGEQYWEDNQILVEYWNLFNRIANVVREVLPDMKIGGPALTWPKPTWLTSFLDCCGKNIDFISWHNYGSGNPEVLTSQIVSESVSAMMNHAKYVHQECEKRNLNLEYFLTEYNVQWVWTPFDVRHANNEGAVFQALVINQLAPLTNGIFVWHLKGHSYGLIDDDNSIRATGQFYLWGREYLIGSVKKYESDNHQIEAIPVVNKTGRKAVLLVNKSIQSVDFTLNSSLGFKPKLIQQLNADWKKSQDIAGKRITLLPYSLTILVE